MIENEDICLWPDGTWCYGEELEEYTWMSDDFEVIKYMTERYQEFWKEYNG